LKATWFNIALNIAMVLVVLIYCARRMSHYIDRRHRLQLGYDAELAVGQELNHLMLRGCRVYHDFPAGRCNIDHVVIGPGGVIAVETKGRAKRDQGGGSAEAKVIVNGEYPRFPYFRDRNFVKQARRQAEWLEKWLSGAVGQAVTVRPALALPGWFVETVKASDVIVINGKNPFSLANPKFTRNTLSEERIQRIAHQLEQRCRDVEPVAYRKEKSKK
jgi:hypothetical protein